MDLFFEISLKLSAVNYFRQSSILDVRLGSEYIFGSGIADCKPSLSVLDYQIVQSNIYRVQAFLCQVWSRLSCHELSWFIGELKKLKDFMNRYSGVSLAQSPNYINRNFYMNPVQGGGRYFLVFMNMLKQMCRCNIQH